MEDRATSKRRTLFFIGLGLVALILLAAGLSALELQPGQPFPMPAPRPRPEPGAEGIELPQLGIFEIFFALIIWVIFPLMIVLAIAIPQLRRALLRALPRFIVLMLLMLVLLRFLRPLEPRPPGEEEVPAGGLEGLPAGEAAREIPEFVTSPPEWFAAIVIAVLAGLLLAIAWFRLRPQHDPSRSLVQEAADALGSLQAGANLKDTVMRCYLEMTRVLESHGVTREKAMTPREFGRHLERLGWSDEHIARLTGLFERVRYGGATPGEREEREAVACLSAIVEAYGKQS